MVLFLIQQRDQKAVFVRYLAEGAVRCCQFCVAFDGPIKGYTELATNLLTYISKLSFGSVAST